MKTYIERAIQYVNENLIVMGNWNAVVGEKEVDKVAGKFGLGRRNERGDKLIINKHNLVIANTLFNHHKRRYTWKMPGDIGRYELDYILVKQKFRNQVKE